MNDLLRTMYLDALERAVYSRDADFALRVTDTFKRALTAFNALESFGRIHAEMVDAERKVAR